jgi:DnaK suppressor protein
MSLTEESKQEFRKLLLDMRRELSDEAKVQHQAARETGHKGDMGDWTTSSLSREYACMLSERLSGRIMLIDEALDAIENGDYGTCEECGEPINEKRLLLMPFARLCVSCQSGVEKRAKLMGRNASEYQSYRRAV